MSRALSSFSEPKRPEGVVFPSGQLQAGPNTGNIATVQRPLSSRGSWARWSWRCPPKSVLAPSEHLVITGSCGGVVGGKRRQVEEAPPPPAGRQCHHWPPCSRQLAGRCTCAGEAASFTAVKTRIDLSFEDRKMAVGVSPRCPFCAGFFFFFLRTNSPAFFEFSSLPGSPGCPLEAGPSHPAWAVSRHAHQ